jgi:hypothetical protein
MKAMVNFSSPASCFRNANKLAVAALSLISLLTSSLDDIALSISICDRLLERIAEPDLSASSFRSAASRKVSNSPFIVRIIFFECTSLIPMPHNSASESDFTSFLLVAAASCSSCMAYPSSSLSVVDNGKDEL